MAQQPLLTAHYIQELLALSTGLSTSCSSQLVFDSKKLQYCSTYNLAEGKVLCVLCFMCTVFQVCCISSVVFQVYCVSSVLCRVTSDQCDVHCALGIFPFAVSSVIVREYCLPCTVQYNRTEQNITK